MSLIWHRKPLTYDPKRKPPPTPSPGGEGQYKGGLNGHEFRDHEILSTSVSIVFTSLSLLLSFK
jgi:hypothetical protein